jgi:hypothetical protein
LTIGLTVKSTNWIAFVSNFNKNIILLLFMKAKKDFKLLFVTFLNTILNKITVFGIIYFT